MKYVYLLYSDGLVIGCYENHDDALDDAIAYANRDRNNEIWRDWPNMGVEVFGDMVLFVAYGSSDSNNDIIGKYDIRKHKINKRRKKIES